MVGAVALHLAICLPKAIACQCFPLPPACVAYAETQIIVLGTVQGTSDGLIYMRVDRTYKGVSEKTLTYYESGMCDGTSVEVGAQYLMYTVGAGTDGCTRSVNAKDADEDLKFLNGLAQAPPTGTVFGQVTVNTGSITSQGEPASGVTVEIQGEGEQRSGKTDSEGGYSFSGLNPGSYFVRATQPGFHESEKESDDNPDVRARACSMANLVLRQNTSGVIGGRVISSDGTPAPEGIRLDLIRMTSEEPGFELMIGFSVETDADGEYAFHEVAPGKYKVVLNRSPTIYWPGGKTERDGEEIEISEAIRSQECNFLLPSPVKLDQ